MYTITYNNIKLELHHRYIAYSIFHNDTPTPSIVTHFLRTLIQNMWRSRMSTINPLNTKRRLLYLKTQFLPRSKYFSSRL